MEKAKKLDIQRCVLLLSGLACQLLGTSRSKVSLVIGVVALLALFASAAKLPMPPQGLRVCFGLRSCAVALFAAVAAAYNFYRQWYTVSELRSVAAALNVSPALLWGSLCVLGFVAALPFLAYIAHMILEPESIGGGVSELFAGESLCRVCTAVAVIGLIAQCVFAFAIDIYNDEAFSLTMIKRTYADMVAVTANDVHPPLYYIILKAFVDFVHIFVPGVPATYLAKLASVIPFILVFVLIETKVKSNWGDYAAAVCAMCLTGVSGLNEHSVNIRMYSWGMLFIFAAFLAFYDILKANSFKSWCLLTLYSLAAAYTQYFCAVSVASLYVSLFIYILKNERGRIKYWFMSVAAALVCYSPWLIVLAGQIKQVSGDYWISEPGTFELLSYIWGMGGSTIMMAVFAAGIISFCLNIKAVPPQDSAVVFAGMAVPLFTALVGLAASWLIRPVLVFRYVQPALVCSWLGITVAVLFAKNSAKIRSLFASIAIVLSIGSIAAFICTQTINAVYGSRVMSFFEQNSGAVYITDNDNTVLITSQMSGDACYKINSGTPQSNIYELLSSGAEVYYISAGEEMERLMAAGELKFEYIGHYFLEGTEGKLPFYRVTKE